VSLPVWLAGAAARLRPPQSDGLSWPVAADRGRALAPEERARLLGYERLMGLAHLTVVPVALAAALVHLDAASAAHTPALAALLGATLGYALIFHHWLPRRWLSRAKVMTGLLVDVAICTAVVALTGYHMSLLVFVFYLVVIAGALTLSTRTVFALCAAVCAAFSAMLPFDPLMTHAPGAHTGHVILFLVSVWLVGLTSATGAAQIQRAERRLIASLRAEHETAERNRDLTRDLARQLLATQALATSLDSEREQSRGLADMVIRAQEEERHRVARELHDEANQTLAALMTTVDAAEQQSAPGDRTELATTLARLRRLAAAALADLQRIATELRPPALDEFGLLPALSKHVAERTEGTTMHAVVEIEGRRRRLPAAVEVALYRIAQEALANAQRHSGASTVRLRLRFLGAAIRLDISDDGAGFAPGDHRRDGRQGLGIPGMRERASIVGGTLAITSRPGGGTRIAAEIPLPGTADLAAG